MTPSAPCISPPNISTARRSHRMLGFWHRLRAAHALHGQHLALSRLNDALLKDIGLTRAQAEAECIRPLWDAPTHWRG